MGTCVFRALVSKSHRLERLKRRLREVSAADALPSDEPQLIQGPIQAESYLQAPLSGRQCVYYKIEAWELTGGQDRIDWFLQFVEERALPFTIGNNLHVDCSNESRGFNWQCDYVMELHTDSEGFQQDEEVVNVYGTTERVMIYRATSERDAVGIVKEGIPSGLKDLLARNRFDLYQDADRKQHKRMRFVEKCIDTAGKVRFIGVVKNNGGRYVLDEVNGWFVRLKAHPFTRLTCTHRCMGGVPGTSSAGGES